MPSEELTVAIWCLPPLDFRECLPDTHLSDAFSSVFKGKFYFPDMHNSLLVSLREIFIVV